MNKQPWEASYKNRQKQEEEACPSQGPLPLPLLPHLPGRTGAEEKLPQPLLPG